MNGLIPSRVRVAFVMIFLSLFSLACNLLGPLGFGAGTAAEAEQEATIIAQANEELLSDEFLEGAAQEATLVAQANEELYGNADRWFDEGDCGQFRGLVPEDVNNWYLVERTSFMGQARLNCRVNSEELREEPCGAGTDVICQYVPGGLNVSLTAYKTVEEAQAVWQDMRESCPFSDYAQVFESGAEHCLEMTDVQDDMYGTLYWRQLTQLEQNTIVQITQIDLSSSNVVYSGLEIAQSLINSYRDDDYLLP